MLISLVLVIPSCGGRRTAQVEPPVPTENKEQLIKNQQLVVQDETEDIDGYISRRGYTMESTPTGLRYMKIGRAHV